jgi:hypothetical protein
VSRSIAAAEVVVPSAETSSAIDAVDAHPQPLGLAGNATSYVPLKTGSLGCERGGHSRTQAL